MWFYSALDINLLHEKANSTIYLSNFTPLGPQHQYLQKHEILVTVPLGLLVVFCEGQK